MSEERKGLYAVRGEALPPTPAPGSPPEPWKETRVVGAKMPRVDGYARVSGSAVYPSDVSLPGMLYGAVLRCPHPHAKVLRVDASRALGMPGVHAVLTGDHPEARRDWTYSQWRPPKEAGSRLFDPVCRFEGEPVAAVAAETPYEAWDAVRAIGVEYEVLPFVSDELEALKPGAPAVHEGGNLVQTENYSRGDVDEGLAQADVVLEETYRTESELHTPMELHGCVASWEGDRLTLWESTQGVYVVQKEVADVLRIPLSKVRVVGHYMGGGFGSKLEAGKYTVLAALLAYKAARPVKLLLTREETYLAAGNRPPANMTLKAGVKKDGTLAALDFSCVCTGGAYPAGGTALVDWLVRDLYACPNVRTEATDVYVNAGPARPFRAPGHPQGAWALEQMMDALAHAIGMDPVELRLRNIPAFSQAREGTPPYTTNGFKECLEEGAKAFGWKEALRRAAEFNRHHTHAKRGAGMAGCSWFVGGGWPPATVILKLYADGTANLNMGASDIGTGTKSVMAMVVAEELGVKTEMVQIENADTGTTQYASASGGSKTVPTEAPTVRAAAIHVKQQLLDMAAADLQVERSDLTFRGDRVASVSDPSKSVRVQDISGLKKARVVVGVGTRGPNPADKAIVPFGAQFCEVEVSTRTGEVRILRFLGAHDSGRVMNRLTYDNQVVGGITMGIGLATTEMRVLDRHRTGKLVNRNWHDYKLPTSMDVPAEITSLPVEIPDDEANTTGAKGLGEPVTIPTAPAVANAVYNAVGLRMTRTPINPLQLSRKLFENRKEG